MSECGRHALTQIKAGHRRLPAKCATEMEVPVLTLEDCIALSALTDDEIAASAEHEHLPSGNYLLHSAGGVPRIKQSSQRTS